MNFYLVSLIKAGLVAFVLVTVAAYLVWVERKVLAHIQLRMGPSRVGPHGLLQPLADLIKLIAKEGFTPPYVFKFFYNLAPFLAVFMALLSICVIPFGAELNIFGVKTWAQLTDLNVGVLFILAISSMGVYGIALAGWASNNKYALLGGLRSSAQMISYELPMTLAIAAPLLMVNSLSLREICQAQGGFYLGLIPRWTIFQAPAPQIFSFFIFLIAGFAETNRIPFDLPEAENELVAGFHTEYSSMKWASFFTAEYCNITTVACMTTILFLGGWHPPFDPKYGSNFIPTLVLLLFAGISFYHGTQPAHKIDRYSFPVFGAIFAGLGLFLLIPAVAVNAMPIVWFLGKTGFLLFVFIWIRGTLPRFRYDQLMGFAWKFLFPVAMINLLATALMVALFG